MSHVPLRTSACLLPEVLLETAAKRHLPASVNFISRLSVSGYIPTFHSSLPILFLASEAEVSLLLNSLSNKQCELDPIYTSLLKDCASVLVHVGLITRIINLSLSSGNFQCQWQWSSSTL